MATQAAEVLDTAAPADSDAAAPARDFEAEARQHGWTPHDDFKGDPNKWVDAETFVKRADEVMPLLKKQTQALRNENSVLKRELRNAITRVDGVERRAYERAMADIEKRMDEAASVGNTAGVQKAREEMKGLHKEATAPQVSPVSKEEAMEAMIEFREQNPWYDKGGLARDYADMLAQKHSDLAEGMRPSEYFSMIAEKVQERYGDRLTVKDDDADDGEKPRRRVLSPVEGVRSNRGKRNGAALTGNDLTTEERTQADRFVRMGVLKDRDEYAKYLKRD